MAPKRKSPPLTVGDCFLVLVLAIIFLLCSIGLYVAGRSALSLIEKTVGIYETYESLKNCKGCNADNLNHLWARLICLEQGGEWASGWDASWATDQCKSPKGK